MKLEAIFLAFQSFFCIFTASFPLRAFSCWLQASQLVFCPVLTDRFVCCIG